MHREVKVGLDKIDSLQYPDLLPEEIDLYLNRSQDILVEKLYEAKKFNTIAELNSTQALIPGVYTAFNYGSKCYRVSLSTLSNTYLYYLSSKLQMTRTAFPVIADEEFIECDFIEEIEVFNYVVDTFNRPVFKFPKVFKNGNYMYLLLDYYTLHPGLKTSSTYQLHYIKSPVRVSYTTPTNCELNADLLHRKVVDLCIQLLLDPIESPRLQQYTQLLTEKI